MNNAQVLDPPSNEKLEAHKTIVIKAVEDRFCKRIDLASRPDLTDRQAIDALRLLLKIARKSALAVEFSSAEFYLLVHGIQHHSPAGATRPLFAFGNPVLPGRPELT